MSPLQTLSAIAELIFSPQLERQPARRLFRAIEAGDITRVTRILDEHPETMQAVFSDRRPAGPLGWAANHGQAAIAAMLIARGASVDEGKALDENPLALAVTGWIQGVAVLNPDMSYVFDPADHAATLRVLLKNGADINVVNSIGLTPLNYCTSGFTEVAEFLIDHGADMEWRLKSGNTVLMCAASGKHDRAVELLLRKGADTRAVNNEGLTALEIAQKSISFADRPQHARTIALLEAATRYATPPRRNDRRPGV